MNRILTAFNVLVRRAIKAFRSVRSVAAMTFAANYLFRIAAFSLVANGLQVARTTY